MVFQVDLLVKHGLAGYIAEAPATTFPTSPPAWHSTTLSTLLQRIVVSYSVPSEV